ncbi:hypothetical protein ARALYDRAFT_336380 [Arabidopsis lyrata subsp. lyrata]|uniref:Subtilisin-like protease fibronectin type-III domain-containing protein n=1 Tax=Arabidopsis lyrata subsp. lyrata TaxID=81972 RepID=D7KIE6_ARALL|nr:hypothetical protein ARALYDRAFT_336380 [Arabidopsis lyrata subsp. lyrata]
MVAESKTWSWHEKLYIIMMHVLIVSSGLAAFLFIRLNNIPLLLCPNVGVLVLLMLYSSTGFLGSTDDCFFDLQCLSHVFGLALVFHLLYNFSHAPMLALWIAIPSSKKPRNPVLFTIWELTITFSSTCAMFGYKDLSITRLVRKKTGWFYKAMIEAPMGVNVTVTPSTLVFNTLRPESSRFKVRVLTNQRVNTRYYFGSLTWTESVHNAVIPVSVRTQIMQRYYNEN